MEAAQVQEGDEQEKGSRSQHRGKGDCQERHCFSCRVHDGLSSDLLFPLAVFRPRARLGQESRLLEQPGRFVTCMTAVGVLDERP